MKSISIALTVSFLLQVGSAFAEAPAPLAPAVPAAPALAAPASPAPGAAKHAAPAPAAAGGYHRVELPTGGAKFPYTVEIPAGWSVHPVKGQPALWLGPEGETEASGDASGVFVVISRASVAEPEKNLENIKKTASAPDSDWSAPLAEVREVGGVRGILVQMDSGTGANATSTLVLKLPLQKTSVDFMGRSPHAEFASHRPSYERILFSVRKAE
jgi:hypothetical protein